MNENPNRIACEKCGAANFPSSANCWQCGETLRVGQIRVERTEGETPPASEPTPGPQEGMPPPGAPPPGPEPPPIYVPPASRRDTDNLVLWGFILAGLGLFGCCCCCGPLLSIGAIVLGAMAYSRGDNRGMWVIIAGAVSLLSGGVSLLWLPWGNRTGPWNGPFPGPIPGPWRHT